MQQAATALMKGGLAAPRVSAKTIAEQLAEKINQKLNYVPQVRTDLDVLSFRLLVCIPARAVAFGIQNTIFFIIKATV